MGFNPDTERCHGDSIRLNTSLSKRFRTERGEREREVSNEIHVWNVIAMTTLDIDFGGRGH